MEPSSTASLDAICVPIASRALSAAGTLDDIVSRMNGGDSSQPSPAAVSLIELSRALRRFSESIEFLRQSLGQSSIISGMLRTVLTASLQTSEQGIAAVDRNVASVLESKGRMVLPESAILSYKNLVDQLMQVVALLIGLVGRPDFDDQEMVLSEPETQALLRDTDNANRKVLSTPAVAVGAQGVSDRRAPASSSPGQSANAGPSKDKDDSGGGVAGMFRSFLAALTATPTEPLVSALCQACNIGNIAQVRGLLEQGVNINGINEDGKTPLICAVRANHLSVAQYLLNNGAGVSNSGRKFGSQKPPLFHAAECGNLAAMRLLLDNGADPNARGPWPGQQFFVDVVNGGRVELIRLLLDRGVDVNTREINGQCVIVRVLQEDRLDVAKLLLNHGADANARDSTGTSMLVDAVKKNRLEIVSLLLSRGADANTRDTRGLAVLAYAVANGMTDAATLLLDHGADANARDHSNNSLIVLAVQNRMVAMTRRLLERGANANTKVDGQNLTLYALYNTLYESDRVELVRLLLKHGADLGGRKNATGAAALAYSVGHGKPELTRLFLDHGADPNGCPPGQNLLAFAVERNDEPLVRSLLQHGADPNTSLPAPAGGNPNGSSSSDAANNPPSTTLLQAVDVGNVAIIRLLLAHGADRNKLPDAVERANGIGRRDIAVILQGAGASAARSGRSAGSAASYRQGNIRIPRTPASPPAADAEDPPPPAYDSTVAQPRNAGKDTPGP